MKEYIIVCDRCNRKDGTVRENAISVAGAPYTDAAGSQDYDSYTVDLCYLCLSDLAGKLLLKVDRNDRIAYLKLFVQEKNHSSGR